MFACPRISETAFGLTFLRSSMVAAVYQSWWNVIGGIPACCRSGARDRLRSGRIYERALAGAKYQAFCTLRKLKALPHKPTS